MPLSLTADQRWMIRAGRDRRVRQVLTEHDQMYGSPFCQYCFVDIEEPKPGKRFCSDRCRKRNADTNTVRGRLSRHSRKRRAIQQREAA